MDEKMTNDMWHFGWPPLPVSIGDTVATPRPPLECHVLFEWPHSEKPVNIFSQKYDLWPIQLFMIINYSISIIYMYKHN